MPTIELNSRGTIRMRIPAISDTTGARVKVIFMAASFFREDDALIPCERTVLVRLHVCTRDTIAQTFHAFCNILATHIGIVRKARRGDGKRATDGPLAAVSVQPKDGETRHRQKPS